MAGTFSQIHIQLVFAVQGRANVIKDEWEERLYRFIAATIKNKGQKPLIINGMPDHIHILLGLRPSMAISDLVRDVKSNSARFINDQKFLKGKFKWQEGYAAFSYSKSQVPAVCRYIENQKEHHKIRSFKDEYLDILKKAEVEFDERYLFEWNE